MFSEADFKRYFDMEGKILTYEDLEKYNSIEELLPDEKDFKIILTETKPNSGHWTTIQRRGNKIIYFACVKLLIIIFTLLLLLFLHLLQP